MTNQIEFDQPAIDGYTCPNCLQWVSGGMVHVCPQPQTPTFDFSWLKTSDQERIANALERIADALEKIAKRN